jgi:hypothetical protein
MTVQLLTSTTPPTTSRSGRTAALDRSARLRGLHRRLTREYADVAPAGLVLATVVRCARDLRRAGCPDDLVAGEVERRVRAVCEARSS